MYLLWFFIAKWKFVLAVLHSLLNYVLLFLVVYFLYFCLLLDRYYFLPVSYFIFTQKAWEMLTGMFLISLLVAVCLLLLVRFLIKHQQQKALTRNMTQIGPCHPIWGHLHLVSNDFRCYWTTWEILKWMTVHHVQIYSPCWYF